LLIPERVPSAIIGGIIGFTSAVSKDIFIENKIRFQQYVIIRLNKQNGGVL